MPEGLTNVIAIAAGGDHSLALRRDGTVVAWGANNAGQLALPEGLSNVIAIAAGGASCAAIVALPESHSHLPRILEMPSVWILALLVLAATIGGICLFISRRRNPAATSSDAQNAEEI